MTKRSGIERGEEVEERRLCGLICVWCFGLFCFGCICNFACSSVSSELIERSDDFPFFPAIKDGRESGR